MTPRSGLGTLLAFADTLGPTGGPTVYSAISGILKIKPPGAPRAKDIPVDAALDGPGHKQHTPGGDDTPAGTFNLPYSDATLALCLGLRKEPENFIVIHSDGDADLFPGVIMEAGEEEIDADRAMTVACQVQKQQNAVVSRHVGWAAAEGAVIVQTSGTVSGETPLVIDLTALPGGVNGTGKRVLRVTLVSSGGGEMQVSAGTGSYEWVAGTPVALRAVNGGLAPVTKIYEGDLSAALIDATHKTLNIGGNNDATVQITITLG